VRAAARSVLSEMQAVVTVLREPGESSAPTEPVPGMAGLDALIDGYRSVGLTIDTVVRGTPVELPAAVDLVAYRAVQESLTNVQKHAGNASVIVELDYQPTSFGLTVTNTGTGPGSRQAGRNAASTGGFGLMGMRERVGSVGGTVRAEPTPDGGFEIRASVPVDQEMLTR
jgi:signal transduction histidine kinase